MIDKILPPEPDEIEVVLIGPGFGETIILHVGNGRWVIIDSCIDNRTGSPAALSYLHAINVIPEDSVDLVIATHWHDDHIRGLHKTVETCTNADFCCSSAHTTREFIKFFSAINGNKLAGKSGTDELFETIEHRSKHPKKIRKAIANTLLKRYPADTNMPLCEVWSLSPANDEVNNSLARVAEQIQEISFVPP